MTVSSSTSSQTFNCDGSTTVFACPFRVLEPSELVGYLITVATNASVPLVNGTDFAVTGVGAANAIATTTTTYSSAYQVNFRRRTQRLQLTDYRDNDPFPAESHENALDRLTHVVQELDTDLGRALLAPEPETGITLPSAEERAGRLLGFDSDGDPVALAPADGSAASLALDLASTTVSTKNAGQVGFNGSLSYISGTIGWELRANGVRPEWFGAVGDGTTNDATAYAAAIAFCQLTRRSLLHTAGAIYALASNASLGGNPITFIGEPYGTLQQGSTRPAAVIRWTGGATPMFTSTSSGWRFVSLAIENFGTATCFLFTNASQSMHFEDLSFLVGSGASRFSRAIFASDSNGLGYSKWVRNGFQGAAPAFIDINGNGSSNGVTQLEVAGGLFESNSLGSVTVIKLTDINVTTLVMRGATYNQQSNELCLVDTTASPRSTTIYSLVITESEIDTPASLAAYRRLKLTNVINAQITGNYWNGSGTETAMATLVNTTVSDFAGNYVRAVAGPFFSSDTLSRVTAGVNFLDTSSTQGIINDSATGSGIIPLTYGTTVTILGQRGPGTGPVTFSIDVTNGSGWTLSLAHPGIGSGGYLVRGQQITVMVRNVSGGAMGSITLAAGVFKLAGSAFPVPANGFSRSVTMVWNGSALVEVNRTTVDVPN